MIVSAGSQLDQRYRIDAEVGRGAMGIVYRAHDDVLDRDVAVKVLSAGTLSDEARERLLREARAAAQLNHPNIVAVYDAGESAGVPFIVEELVAGQSLHECAPLALEQTIGVARQVCAALSHAHAHGIIHRDLKPENVLITKDGTVKLMDFGLARSAASRLTAQGMIVGTVFYLAPEQALDQPMDGRADLYSLGVLLYELTTGKLPFIGDDPLAVISQHLNAPVVPPRAHNPAVPLALDALIVRLLSKQPDDRPASADQVATALDDVLRPEPAATTSDQDLSLLDRIVRGRLVGRRAELSEAIGQLRHAMAGEGRVLLISGEPGVGKTRLMRELTTHAQVSGAKTLLGECYAEGGAPYSPIAQMIREDRANLQQMPVSESVLADLLSLAPDLKASFPNVHPNPPLNDPRSEQQRMFESVVAWATALAQKSPLVLVLDDAHWADSGTLSLTRHVARRTRKLPLLIVATYREVELDEARPWHEALLDLNRERLATRIKLARLTREQTRDLLAAMFEEEITPEFLEGVYRETEGNPFFVEEVCKALIEEGKLYFAEGQWHRPPMDEIEIPQSLRLAIQARVGKLPPETQETLRLASVLGREFDFETLKRASDLDEDSLITALENAEHAQLIGEAHNGHAGSVKFVFGHALIRATLYESVSGLRRKRLHHRAALAFESAHPNDLEAIAQNLQAAGDSEKARAYFARAGDRALGLFAYAEAERDYRAALELGGDEAANAIFLSQLGLALAFEDHYNEAIENWHEAIKLYRALGDEEQMALLYSRSARWAWVADDAPRGLELAREGLAALPEQRPTSAMAKLLHETARAYFFNGLLEESRQLVEKALQIAEQVGDTETQAEVLSTQGLVLASDRLFQDSLQAYTRAIQLAEPAGLVFTAARAHNNFAALLGFRLGDWRAARDNFLKAAELARRARSPGPEVFYLSNATGMTQLMGELGLAEEELSRLRELLTTIPPSSLMTGLVQYVEGLQLRYRGEWQRAIQILDEQLADARLRGNLQAVCGIENPLAEIFIELGRWDGQADNLREAVELGDRGLGEAIASRGLLAVVLAHQDKMEEAQRVLAEAETTTRGQPTIYEQELLAQAGARLAAVRRNWPAALELFDKTAALEAQMGKQWYRAQTLCESAEVCLARGEEGDRQQAAKLLREAKSEFERMQVPIYAEQIQERLQKLEQGP